MESPEFSNIQAILFDYGGTLDTGGRHWSEVMWEGYEKAQVPVSQSEFYESYVHTERMLGMIKIIKPEDDFRKVLIVKLLLQLEWLLYSGFLKERDNTDDFLILISDFCYTYVSMYTTASRQLLENLSEKYRLALVTNFYGNINTVLKEFKLDKYFEIVVESASVGVRKPNAEIFAIACRKLNVAPETVLVVGDSHQNDILPAESIGCKTLLFSKKYLTFV